MPPKAAKKNTHCIDAKLEAVGVPVHSILILTYIYDVTLEALD